ncbi:M23 family metallopeptidase [Paenibacillus sp.]|uniref:M23 family metallopeptidase n=1 Tax=Paenibacillus sp. TaxID=58172 RepID=UPI00281268C5|nr:M23 family metallopeptidase [Paenibacillus sp.]
MALAKNFVTGALAAAVAVAAASAAPTVSRAAPADQSAMYRSEAESARQARQSMLDTFTERKALYDSVSAVTGIPWFNLAAVDQYERTLSLAHPKTRPLRDGLVAIHLTEYRWVGFLNPNHQDTNLRTIRFFDGFGRDGDGDGRADRNNDADVLYSMADFLLRYGTSPADFDIGIWEYYQNDRSVKRIKQFAKIYSLFGTLDLHRHAFILPLGGDYSYRSTWGAARSYGGYRIHEGTDLFAHYGMPVRSAAYGVVEVMGWNRYGGWRVGIRDLNNVYHYYAHLSGFNKKFKEGDIVQPGDVVGWVGSSGYGKPGTQGKFPPHLHYGLYRDNGLTEWSFDPYPHLRKWEREERNRKRSGK